MNVSLPPAIYVERAEERQILGVLDEVRRDRQSRAVLLYGPGGVGKTSMVRQMCGLSADDHTEWLDPIDVDDPECWLLSNLEYRVATRLDPAGAHFAPFQRQLSQLPESTHADISHETIVSHLSRIKKVFVSCYADYVTAEEKTVVIVFDTVETIRGTNLLLTLTQWMKALPRSTLFILSGRPVTGARSGSPDPIQAELKSRHQGMPVVVVPVGEFGLASTSRVIAVSEVAASLEGDEQEKLVLLTGGRPLWIDFTIDYLRAHEMPQEVTQTPLEYLEEHLPYGERASSEGEQLREAFLRRLVAPYQESDFWRETIKRLAVIRQPVAMEVWWRLMSDWELPEGLSMTAAWERLLSMPWIRARGNGCYLTLHDAVAEEFALRLFPLHDSDQLWRHRIWRRALDIYRQLAVEVEADLREKEHARDEHQRRFEALEADRPAKRAAQAEVIDDYLEIDTRTRELDQYRAASLYYRFLTDYPGGCEELLGYFARAERAHDAFFQDLLVLYLQRFLPEGTYSGAFNDVIKAKLDDFRRWLTRDRPDLYLDLETMVARYLINSAQSGIALELLGRLPVETASAVQRHRIRLLCGNACLRIPGKVREGSTYFDEALAEAKAMDSPDRYKFLAQAYNEHGFYNRNIGLWPQADESYAHARDAISSHRSTENLASDRQEMASILTNWAYVKGLNGSYRDGTELVDAAITIRRKLELVADEGMSWSVCGEVHRYAERFHQAWAAYDLAEQLFAASRSGDRLGLIYQERAICLYQAYRKDINLTSKPIDDAKDLITLALDICQEQFIRGYPSALNRAGRIFGYDDPSQGLAYLHDGIAAARELLDGWFWYANLVEYAELNYRLWDLARKAGDGVSQQGYRSAITGCEGEISEASEVYSFSDLEGRWGLLQAHLAVDDYLATGDRGKLAEALAGYTSGFTLIAHTHVGSSGAASVSREFTEFAEVVGRLPEPLQAQWQVELRQAWTELKDGKSSLLARLEEIA